LARLLPSTAVAASAMRSCCWAMVTMCWGRMHELEGFPA
jgi:hypothetical protein